MVINLHRNDARAVFLDRDGTINKAIIKNRKPHPPSSLDNFELLPGVQEGLKRLKEAGFLLIVITNQPDVARGQQSRSVVESFHRLLYETLPIDDIKVCYSTEVQAPNHYKPAPGMILEAAEQFDIDLAASFVVGDRWRDIGAGKKSGCYSIFIDNGYDEKQPEDQDFTVNCFSDAVSHILDL